ncbi:tetratricopeptide repeat protein 4-like, partial [Lampetra fluviatilis]
MAAPVRGGVEMERKVEEEVEEERGEVEQVVVEEVDEGMDALMERFKGGAYAGRWNEATWEEEMERVPMFMKKLPHKVDPALYPELACINSILESTIDSTTALEMAMRLKLEGNRHFAERRYSDSIASYSLALTTMLTNTTTLTNTLTNTTNTLTTTNTTLTNTLPTKTTNTNTNTNTTNTNNTTGGGEGGEGDGEGGGEGGGGEEVELKVVLLTNRAAANFHLGNFGSALKDAQSALTLRPNHTKALVRAVDCCVQLCRVEEAAAIAAMAAARRPGDAILEQRRLVTDAALRELQRDRRRAQSQRRHQQQQTQRILNLITMDRKIRLNLPRDQLCDLGGEGHGGHGGHEGHGGHGGHEGEGGEGRLPQLGLEDGRLSWR